jgi:hypothetical protein
LLRINKNPPRRESAASFILKLAEKRCRAEDANAKKSLSTTLRARLRKKAILKKAGTSVCHVVDLGNLSDDCTFMDLDACLMILMLEASLSTLAWIMTRSIIRRMAALLHWSDITCSITAPTITLHSRSFSRNTNNNNPYSVVLIHGLDSSSQTWSQPVCRARLGCRGTRFARSRSKRDGIARRLFSRSTST